MTSIPVVPQNKIVHSKLAIALLIALPSIGFAEPIACQISPLAQYLTPETNNSKAQMIVNADQGYLTDSEGKLEGNAEIFYGNDKIDSQSFTIDRVHQIVTSSGDHVRYATPGAVLVGSKIIHLLPKNETHLSNAQYYLKAEPNIQGRASQIDHRGNLQNTLLKEATYSTCAVDNEIWKVRAKDLDINHATGRAEAYNATFDLLGVPVLYAPYLSFPIDGKRHSGFLFPEVSISKSSGLELFIPYYFNIAPNMDAILAPGLISKRGFGVKGNFRYLNEWQEMELSGTYITKDRLYDHKKRWIIKGEQSLNFTKKFTGNILYQNISDEDYLRDIEDQTGLLDDTTLERHAVLDYRTENWTAKLRVQDFIVTDREIIPYNPYARMPQLLFNSSWNLKGLNFGIESEFVRFSAKNDHLLDISRPHSATRIDLMPSVSYRFENSWAFIEPTARFRFTQYDLSYRHDVNRQGKKDRFSRSLPILSLDAGIFLEKNISFDKLFGGGDFVQTLEPRLFYLYAPYRNQSHIPLFDTSEITPSYYNLFNYNDFYGADRQSNANQLTTAFTTRIFDESNGAEKFYLSMGQTQYFTNPRITLGNDLNENDDKIRRSSFFAQTNMEVLPNLRVGGSVEWSPNTNQTTRATFDINYRPDDRKMFNIGYRYNRDLNLHDDNTQIDQIDASFFWQLNNRWAVAGRYNYAFSESKMIDSQLGVEYGDCCVTTRVAARYYRNNIYDSKKQWRIYLEFDLSGMGNVGQNTEKLWEQSITGFKPRRNRYF
ncbi:LPS assembly protein LptD [Ignatzschineria rhizosphaerae]|uniref:LPS-assembly protein LptD n=1 Tax=Ignatzschineria rhizosphaerae TaxID=2923279 RepID=A0ABY3X6I6_9GAMM|nr:LPS assembly protein LptD [Ignatzschineria rhizosphaerae]UNM97369.1 LPS assembly protein LptD [Ignatzschineria rhizosphaerae]